MNDVVLTYSDTLNRFVCKCSYFDKEIPKSKGFLWNPKEKVWYAPDLDIALELLVFADSETSKLLDEMMAKRKEVFDKSLRKTTSRVFPAPDGLKYYPFQNAGIEFLLDKSNVLLADEMGLGKTPQVIGLINELNLKKILVVCPNIVKLNWKNELQRWLFNKELSISVVYAQEYNEADIMIINYDILDRYDQLAQIKWDLVAVDESHYVKNAKTVRYKRLKEILKNANRKVFMTGTPIMNKPIELWTTIQELCPYDFGNWWNYANKYCDMKQGRFGLDVSGASNLEELQAKLRSSVMIRRRKEEVLKELPDITRQVIVLNKNGNSSVVDDEKEQFESLKQKYQSDIDGLKVGALGYFNIMAKIRHNTALAKVPDVIDFVDNILDSGEKVLLFAHHHDVIDKFKEKYGDSSVVITGETKIEDRQKAIDSFQNDEKIRVFIGSIQATGVGITLTASSNVVFAELDWVPANMSQAEGRAHRIGQKSAVNVYHLVLDGTIDSYLAKTIVRKQEISDKALDNSISLSEIFHWNFKNTS